MQRTQILGIDDGQDLAVKRSQIGLLALSVEGRLSRGVSSGFHKVLFIGPPITGADDSHDARRAMSEAHEWDATVDPTRQPPTQFTLRRYELRQRRLAREDRQTPSERLGNSLHEQSNWPRLWLDSK